MSKKTVKSTTETLQKEDVIQAVVMCDSFSTIFSPISISKPTALFPLVNKLLLDYTLDFLALSGVQEVILFCVTHADLIKEHVRCSKWSTALSEMLVTILVSEGCRSMGDAMRDLDAKSVIRGDFILLNGDTVANLQLSPILDLHKRQCKQDKGAVMTLIYKEAAPGHRIRTPGDEVLLAIDSTSNRVLFHQKMRLDTKKIVFPLEMFMDNPNVELIYNVADTSVCVCTNAVPQLFTDNFDYQTRDDFVRGLLLNEEILASTMYCHRLRGDQYAARVDSWHAYQAVSHDVIHRWTYPFVPNVTCDHNLGTYSYLRRNVYRQLSVKQAKGSVLKEDVVIAEDSSVGEDTVIERSVIGRKCFIGRNVTVSDSFIWANVNIQNDCVISRSVISEDCQLASGVTLRGGCVLGPGVHLLAPIELTGVKLVASPEVAEDEYDEQQEYEKISDKAYQLKPMQVEDDSEDEEKKGTLPGLYLGIDQGDESEDESEVMSGSSGDMSDRGSPIPDDTNMFYNEVMDSLARGYEDKLACDNLILEINSSRYAYNVSVKEVNYHVVRALLNLPEGANAYLQRLVQQLGYFLPILENYVKRNQDAQMDCLQAIEEVAECRAEVRDGVQKLLHLLYDKDVIDEQSILKWHKTPNVDLPSSIALRNQVSGFIKWLQEADEESDSDDSD